ncbi:MAG: PD-(D/E)XK nuclease family protein [Thermoplasmata archaeon]
MAVYSHTRLETFENCPLQYKLAYIDRIEVEEEGIEAYMGTKVHSALEKLYVDLQRSKLNTLEELLEFYRREWERDWHDGIVIARKGYTPQNYFDTGRRCIERYYSRFRPFDQGTPVGIERTFSFTLGPHTVRGVIDRIDRMPDGSYEIHDYKTSSFLPTQAQIDEDRQLALYQLGVQRMWSDATNVKLVWHFLQFGEELVSTRTPEQLEALEAECAALIERIEGEREFKPRPGPLCDWCPYWSYCPEKRHLVKIAELEPPDAAREEGFELVNRYAALKARERELAEELEGVRQRLIDYARREGVTRVRGSSAVASVNVRMVPALPSRSSEEEEYDRVAEVVRGAGLWDQFSVLDSHALLRALEEGALDRRVARTLAPFVRRTERPEVRLGRLREEE